MLNRFYVSSFGLQASRTSCRSFAQFSEDAPRRPRSDKCTLRVSETALEMLQEATALYATQLLAGAQILVTYRRRVGVDETDLRAHFRILNMSPGDVVRDSHRRLQEANFCCKRCSALLCPVAEWAPATDCKPLAPSKLSVIALGAATVREMVLAYRQSCAGKPGRVSSVPLHYCPES